LGRTKIGGSRPGTDATRIAHATQGQAAEPRHELLFQIYELRNIHEDTRCCGRTQPLNPKESKGAKPNAHYDKDVLKIKLAKDGLFQQLLKDVLRMKLSLSYFH